MNAAAAAPLRLLTVVIPARDEEGCVGATVTSLTRELQMHDIAHEIVVVDDGSRDATWQRIGELSETFPAVRPIRNDGPHGFGRAVSRGLDAMTGDAVVIMMADDSDDFRDVVRYWRELQRGADCVFGSRFVPGGGAVDYPLFKLVINRVANTLLRILFAIRFNDTTNAFKAYRREVIDGCRPLVSAHFNLTVELPLKAIIRGYRWSVIPITWRNRRAGESHLQLREMGSRYLFIVLYLWLEKHLSRGDYMRDADKHDA
jgi:dolichol-phosphate mannosyltransferase